MENKENYDNNTNSFEINKREKINFDENLINIDNNFSEDKHTNKEASMKAVPQKYILF